MTVSLDALVSIKKEIASRVREFPKGCCTLVASSCASQLRLPFVSGLFLCDDGRGAPHCWNRDRNGRRIYDLTPEQIELSGDATKYLMNHSGVQFLVVPARSEFARRHYLRDVHLMY